MTMSALGQKQTCAVHQRMSALCHKRTFGHSFDQLVGALLELKRNIESERLGGLEIDHQLVLGRRLHWKVGRLLALEDAIDVCRGALELVNPIGTVADQPSGRNKAAAVVHSR